MSFDSADENAAFARKFGFNFPLLCDTDRAMGMAYGACDAPSDENARRIGVIIGPDGKVKHYFRKVSAAAFPGEALALI